MVDTTAKAKRTPRNRNRTDQKIRYLVKTVKNSGGNFLIEIPASWKVTFGWVNPSSKGGGYNEGHCMRVWEGEKLRAVYDDVVSFRDMSIPLARETRKETGESKWEHDSEGNFSESTEIKVDKQLVVETTADNLGFDE